MLNPVLIDFDGVLRLSKNPAPDAGFFINSLMEKGVPCGVLSNSTVISRQGIIDFLFAAGVNKMPPVLTPGVLLQQLIQSRGITSLNVYAAPYLEKEFAQYLSEQPEYVVVGDMEERWDYGIINEILQKLLNGSKLIALHNNRYWKNSKGILAADAGFFVAGFEYTTRVTAEVLGKPSAEFFRLGLQTVTGSRDGDFIMIGDDIVNDAEGAVRAGGEAIIILTGKTTRADTEKYAGSVQFSVVSTLTEAADLLNK